jgi:hypothetical protein
MMTLNSFYGAGRVACIRDGQFELAVGRGVRLGCRLSRKLAHRLNGFPLREGSWIYVFGPLCLEPGGGLFVRVVFVRLLRHRPFDGGGGHRTGAVRRRAGHAEGSGQMARRGVCSGRIHPAQTGQGGPAPAGRARGRGAWYELVA